MKHSNIKPIQSTLIIIRGNSGSGKTTIAKALQSLLGSALLISQDVVRRDMLNVKDIEDNPSIELIKTLALYGKSIVPYVIIEGILAKKRYGYALHELARIFNLRTLVVYLDISFQETLIRHRTKVNQAEFGEREMNKWWLEKDYLEYSGEIIFTNNVSRKEIIDNIIKSLQAFKKS